MARKKALPRNSFASVGSAKPRQLPVAAGGTCLEAHQGAAASTPSEHLGPRAKRGLARKRKSKLPVSGCSLVDVEKLVAVEQHERGLHPGGSQSVGLLSVH